MKVFVSCFNGGTCPASVAEDISLRGLTMAGTDYKVDTIIIIPEEYIDEINDDNGDSYHWKISSNQHTMLMTTDYYKVQVILFDEEDGEYFRITPHLYKTGDRRGDYYIITEDHGGELYEVLNGTGIPVKESSPSEYQKIADSLGMSGGSIATDNAFIDSIMNKTGNQSSFADAPLEPSASFTTATKESSSFLDDTEEIL